MNPYIKQFPDLMSGKKIMYVHGFLSSAQSGTVKMLQELMPTPFSWLKTSRFIRKKP